MLAPSLWAKGAPHVAAKAVAKSLSEHAQQWEAAIQTHKPRLFYSNTAWPEVMKAIDSMPAPRAEYREAFFKKADKQLEEPIPAYLPPETVAGTRDDARSLYSAQEELWQRDVGDQIFGYSFAVRLRPNNEAYSKRLHDLVMIALTYETWGRPKSIGPNADLSAGHIGRGIALAYDWHRDLFTEEERLHIRNDIAKRMPDMLKALYGGAYWANGYEENHNHVSVTALGYCGIAFYNEIPEAPMWLSAARLNFINVGRFMSADGSSVEGVSYWKYGMLYILQFIEATRPIIDSDSLYELNFLQNAASYRLMASTTDLAGNIPWGDAMLRDWSGPHHILFRLADQYDDTEALWLAENLAFPLDGSLDEHALQMLWASQLTESAQPPSELDHRLNVNDMVTTRSGWAPDDYLLSIKAGYTNRNHSHLDAGALALAFGDEWLLIAPGYGTGGSDSNFWLPHGPRWEFFSNATESHATLLINGKNQRFSKDARANITDFLSSSEWSWTSVDLSGVYEDVNEVQRDVLHRRGDYILVFDSVQAQEIVTVEWLSQFRKRPQEEPDGSLLVDGKKGDLRLRAVTPKLTFSERKPTKPNVDVKKNRHFSYATKQTGEDLTLVTLLQPIFKSVNQTPLIVRMQHATPESNRLTIAGEGWTDHIAWSREARKLHWPIDVGGEISSTLADAKIHAKLAVIRTDGETILSFLAIDATVIELPGLKIQSDLPFDLAAELDPDGVWKIGPSSNTVETLSITDVPTSATAAPTEGKSNPHASDE